MDLPLSRIRTQPLKNLYQAQGVSLSVLRLDELHPLVSGNKWFKLSGYLEAARGRRGLITWGGAWSNHLLATAAACRASGLEAIGLVRGEASDTPSATLADAAALGMQLRHLSREAYRRKELPADLAGAVALGHFLEVPEGGAGAPGCAGAATIASVTEWEGFTHVLAAVGTGTTAAGLAAAALPHQSVTGIVVLRGAEGMERDLLPLLAPEARERLRLEHGYHFGGYARTTPELLEFMNDWYRQTGIPTDIVYTGKLFAAADALIRGGRFAPGSRILAVHSGGLQGNRSLPEGTLIF